MSIIDLSVKTTYVRIKAVMRKKRMYYKDIFRNTLQNL